MNGIENFGIGETSAVRDVEWWRAIVAAQGSAKQSAASYCRGQEINYNQFRYYRNKFRKELATQPGLTQSVFVTPVSRRKSFIPVCVEEGRGVRLKFPQGLILESDVLPPAAWLIKIALRLKGI